MELRIKKLDQELQIAFAEVYVPGFPDAQGDHMTEIEVRKMAHTFLAKGVLSNIDTQHDNVTNGSMVVESFIARKGDTDFIPGSWVVGVHIPEMRIWLAVKSGEINGFSIEALVKSVPRVITLEVPEQVVGKTSIDAGDNIGEHQHNFWVQFDGKGNMIGGGTDEDPTNGHTHEILRGTLTEIGSDGDPHTHRYSFLEGVITGGIESTDIKNPLKQP